MQLLLISIMLTDSWRGLELRHLGALAALAETGSFGRAAERLDYTQSAISQQIAALERIVGEQLVDRPGGPRPISLTEAGRLLLRHAQSIEARLLVARADLIALQTGEAGTIRVGTFQSVGARILPELMRRFTRQWPQIDVQLSEHEDERIAVELERGTIDVGFVLLPAGDAPVETVELLRDPYVLVVAAGSPLARGRPSLRRLADEPLVGFRAGHAIEPVVAAFRAEGLEPRWTFRSNDNPVVQGFVAAGIGSAVMPRLTVDASDPRIEVVDLGGAIAPRIIAIAKHRDRYIAPAARAFVETAQDSVRREL